VTGNNKQAGWDIESLIELIESSAWAAKHPNKELLKDFARIYFSRESADNMAHHSNEEWLAIYRSHCDFFFAPYEGRYALRVVNIPEISRGGTFIQVVAKDMPFLVDSLSMAVSRGRYGAQYLLTSAGFTVCRNKKGEVTSVLPYSLENELKSNSAEAIVMIEVAHQQAEECRAEIEQTLNESLYEVDLAVTDWKPMKHKLQLVMDELLAAKFSTELQPQVDEAVEFLKWISKDHFIYFGCREYDVVGEGDEKALRLLPDSCLGVFRGKKRSAVLKQYQGMLSGVRDQALAHTRIVTFSKTAKLAKIHRDDNTGYIVIKRLDANENVIGEVRFLGLLTSAAYTQPATGIPILRKKALDILEKMELPPGGHLSKEMLYTINNLPRDDFMHATVELLTEWCESIAQVVDRHRTRVFFYLDSHKRNLSCMVYMPRENMSSGLAKKMQEYFIHTLQSLNTRYDARLFGASTVRSHFQIRVDPEIIDSLFNPQQIELAIIEMTKTWSDRMHAELVKYYGDEEESRLLELYRDAFPAGYQENFTAQDCIADIAAIERVINGSNLSIRTCTAKDGCQKRRIKLFRMNNPLPLSDVLPILENMGVRVDSEFPYKIKRATGETVWLSDFEVVLADDLNEEINSIQLFKSALYHSWAGLTSNDMMNKLVIKADLSWQKVRVLRAYASFFKQIKFEISQAYISSILVERDTIAQLLIDLFYARFDPDFTGDRTALQQEIEQKILAEMESISSLDEDRVCRQYLYAILATDRTNFFKRSSDTYIALKINSSAVPGMVEPAPAVEAFVYSASFEGVHLRTSRVARGGLRWSSRKEDYRTEVLGLECAQEVKNSVIVPSGAKGGFILKRNLNGMSRAELQEEGRRCYALFMHGLLDLVDNIENDEVVFNDRVVRHDEPDSYLVVAADKGTATFSDLANSVAEERGFWLGDAFASGGSNGYDHKKMGITAKGAWVSVTRHFKELGVDLHKEAISVVGIGDMSGDVFGNGMLLSKNLKLKGAFNHIHIFVDPNPDAASSFIERKRLFDTPGSTWVDYKKTLISKGGGIFDRSAKSIALTPEMQSMLGTEEESLVPTELIRHMMCAEVDLLWNGGIGTYVKAKSEEHSDVGDPANDRLRVNGSDLRCRVVGEGGNLGLTQLGRIEFEHASEGLICTDFIDNSAGVNCSDVEVNIKMLLNECQLQHGLSDDDRNSLLQSMTEDVSSLVLVNNEKQTSALHFLHYFSEKNASAHANLIEYMEKRSNLDLQQEKLPSPAELRDRSRERVGLALPEICTLFSHTKLLLSKELVRRNLLEDPDLRPYLFDYFPDNLCDRYSSSIEKHKLANEIICTVLINNLSADMGITFFYVIKRELEVSVLDIVRAYVAVVRIFSLQPIIQDVDNLCPAVAPDFRHTMRSQIANLIRRSVRWLLHFCGSDFVISEQVERFSPVAKELASLVSVMPIDSSGILQKGFAQTWTDGGVAASFAQQVAGLSCAYHAFNVCDGAHTFDVDTSRFGQAYFFAFSHLGLDLFREKIDSIRENNDWAELVSYSIKQDLELAQINLANKIISMPIAADVETKFSAWLDSVPSLLEQWTSLHNELNKTEAIDSAIIVMGIRILQKLVDSVPSK
jgi:glutamate dehydrogenase